MGKRRERKRGGVKKSRTYKYKRNKKCIL